MDTIETVDSIEFAEITEVLSKEETAKPEVKYGPTGNGEYFTPYESTVVFHPSSMFESTVAILSKRAQLVPITGEIDYNSVADTCEHPSPRVIIFGSEFSREALIKFLDRGFQSVRVFTTDSKYTDTVNCINADGTENIVTGSFNPHVETFTVDNMYDHLVISEGITPYYILEHVASGAFSKYQSVASEVNYETGKFFCQAVLATGIPLYEMYNNLCGSYKGIENINSLIIQGRTMQMERNRLASDFLCRGIYFMLENVKDQKSKITEITENKVYAVSSSELVNEMLSLAPIHPKIVKENVQFVLFYVMRKVDDIYGWQVTLVTVGKELSSALELLKQYSSNATGTYGIASTWVSKTAATNLLPFIY